MFDPNLVFSEGREYDLVPTRDHRSNSRKEKQVKQPAWEVLLPAKSDTTRQTKMKREIARHYTRCACSSPSGAWLSCFSI
jgi:hypothetical protein